MLEKILQDFEDRKVQEVWIYFSLWGGAAGICASLTVTDQDGGLRLCAVFGAFVGSGLGVVLTNLGFGGA